MLEVRPPVAAFAQAMETQLRAHDDRPGWKQDVLLDLFAHLTEEVCELGRALNISKPILSKLVITQLEKVFGETLVLSGAAPAEILREAADVGNMAMMCADVAGALPPPGPPSGIVIAPEVWEGLCDALTGALTLVGECGDLTGEYPTPGPKWAAWCAQVDTFMTKIGVPSAEDIEEATGG